MKAILKYPLYSRPEPTNTVEAKGYLAKDTVIDVQEIVDGTALDGISSWYKAKDGFYYWGGGINLVEKSSNLVLDFQSFLNSSLDGKKLISGIDYNALLDVNTSLKSKQGENVIIGILDHPISSSIKLENDIIRPFHIADPLFNFHGNFISGLIAGINGVKGLSNKVKIMELPIYNERATKSGINIDNVIKFLNDFDQPMILNISNSMDSRFNESIKALRKDVIVVASAGTGDALSGNTIFHPATQENVIAVGALNKTSGRPLLNNKVEFIISNFDYASYEKDMDSFALQNGDSFSCAIVSSIIALLISSGKTTFDITSIRKELANISKDYSTISSFNSFNLINVKA